jgi:aminopeptidase N
VLTPPGETDIAREIGRDIDPDAIFAARAQLRAAIGTHLAPALSDRYRDLGDRGPYRPDAAGAGRRALRNVCLDLLVAAEQSGAVALAAAQYEAADNMTDRLAALMTLSLRDVPQRAHALTDFYTRYGDDPLIVDKWLSLQAAIPEPATLARVKALTAHAAFSFANPNRVRALIGAFTMANQTQFNRADGAGYGFLVDTVLAPAAHWRKPRCGASRWRRRCRAMSATSRRARWARGSSGPEPPAIHRAEDSSDIDLSQSRPIAAL